MEKKVLEKRPALCRFAKAACYLLFAPAFIVAAISGCSPSDAPTPSASRLKASMGDGSSASSKTETEKSEPKAPEKISPEEPIRSPVEPSKKTTYPVRFYFGEANPITVEVEEGAHVEEPSKEKIPFAIKSLQGWYEDMALTREWRFNDFNIHGPTNIYAKYDAHPLHIALHAPYSAYDITYAMDVEYGKYFDSGFMQLSRAFSNLPKYQEMVSYSKDEPSRRNWGTLVRELPNGEFEEVVDYDYGGAKIKQHHQKTDFEYVAKSRGTGSVYASSPEELFGKEFYRIKVQGSKHGVITYDYPEGSVFDFYQDSIDFQVPGVSKIRRDTREPIDLSNFGKMPQTLVTEDALSQSLDGLIEREFHPNDDGNYVFQGKEYRYAIAHPYNDSVLTEDTNAKFEDGKRYWFEVKPIEWRVLKTVGDYSLITPKKLLFVNEYGLDRNGSQGDDSTFYAMADRIDEFKKNLADDEKESASTALSTPNLRARTLPRATYIHSLRRHWLNGYSSTPKFLKWSNPVKNSLKGKGLEAVNAREKTPLHDSGYHVSSLREELGILGVMCLKDSELLRIMPYPIDTCPTSGLNPHEQTLKKDGRESLTADCVNDTPYTPYNLSKPKSTSFWENPLYLWSEEWQKGNHKRPEYRDRVFLLSDAEAMAFFESNEDRVAYPTDYALAMGAYQDPVNGAGEWETRTVHSKDERSYIRADGAFNSTYVPGSGYEELVKRGCVRFGMWVKTKGSSPLHNTI